jgi:5-methylthioadenosine/S-adenosylhomocysteine deaminase
MDNILIRGVGLPEGTVRDIFVEDGRIAEIAACCARTAHRVIDGSRKVALPAFINGHTHAAMTLLRGYADDMPLKPWLEEKIWVLEAKLTGEDVYWGTRLACLEMIKNGVTVFNDMYWFWEDSARAVCDSGIRGVLSGVFIDMFDRARGEEQIARNIDLYATAARYAPNVSFALGPHAVYSVSPESLRWVRDFSQERRLPIHMHLCESEDETIFTRDRYGLSPVEFLDREGLLSERFIGAHGCWLTDKDAAILARRGAGLVTNPVSNLKLCVGRTFPYRLVHDHAIPYCFGTDGCSSNNGLDMMETMKFASLLAKFSTNDPTFLPARETLDRATRGAGRMFSLDGWEIAVGSTADIILLDLDRPEFVPNFDTYSDIVYSAHGGAVDTVISLGRVVMENRRVEGEEEVMERAMRIARGLPSR